MARLATTGFEVQMSSTTSNLHGESEISGSGTTSIIVGSPTYNTTTVRSGAASLSCAAASTMHRWTPTLVLDRTYYIRGYFYFAGLPVGATGFLMTVVANSLTIGSVRINTSNQIILASETAVIATGPTLSAGQWYRVELELMIPTAGSGTLGLVLDGKPVARSTAADVNNSVTSPQINMGWCTAAAVAQTILVDDCAINDNQGANQNSFPGPGKIVLLKATSVNALGTGWEGPQTTGSDTTNLHDNVDNTPPLGVAHADTDANANRYVFNAANLGAASNLDMNVATYASAGIRSVDWINIVEAMVRASCDSTTGTNNAVVRLVSNPADAGDTTVNLELQAVAGTEPAGWKSFRGAARYDPVVDVNTSPVIRFAKTTTGVTRAHMADLMGLIVEYHPSSAALYPLHRRRRHRINR